MTVKQTIMTFAVATMMMTMATTTANADTLDKTAEIANQTTQVANDISNDVKNDGLIETIDKNEEKIEGFIDKVEKLAYKFGENLDEAVDYTKETENKNIFTSTSNFISILLTDNTKEQVLNKENQDKSMIDTAKEQVANNDLQSSTKQALKHQFSGSGFASVPEGFGGFLLVGIRVLLGIIAITTFGLLVLYIRKLKGQDNNGDIKSKNAKIDRAYVRGQNLLSKIR
ncbi:hypothetical protein AB3H99_03935 [Enterococcus sp. GC33]|uniref:hypothetical protein n=1 Tax=unclassified Enterococcus TaxID=2608891 RepID=UPI0034A087B2